MLAEKRKRSDPSEECCRLPRGGTAVPGEENFSSVSVVWLEHLFGQERDAAMLTYRTFTRRNSPEGPTEAVL